MNLPGCMATYIRGQEIKNGFFALQKRMGVLRNFDNEDSSVQWDHFYADVPQSLVTDKNNIGSKQSVIFNAKNVFKRALEEITTESIEIVLDLIKQGSLYRGDQYERQVKKLSEAKIAFGKVSVRLQDNFCWKHCVDDVIVSGIRNSAIGTLLVDLSGVITLEVAVACYEAVTAPSNYKRPTALVTPRMIEDARTTVEELGLSNVVTDRRFARYTDCKTTGI